MPLNITIPTTSTSDGPTPFTLYTIRISAPLRTTTVQKRYSDFAALHSLLTTQAGAAPPVPLPGKSWLGGGLGKLGLGSTAGSPELIETRQRGLEAYLCGIEGADDARWRGTDAWRAFLDLGSGVPARNGAAAGAPGLARDAITSAGAWLDAHAELKSRLQETRLWLTRREQAGSVARQHEAGANAKRGLVRAGTLIQALEEGLERLSGKRGTDEWSGDRLGDGEVRRRRDLIGAARKEREGLGGVLNTMAAKSAASSAPAPMDAGAATQGEKEGLFRGAAVGGAGAGRRVLGAPAKETERTRELDNEGVLQLQKQIMAEQDGDLMDLAKVARRMREMGVQINEEIVLQNQMLGLLDDDVDRVAGKMKVARKRIDKIK